MDYIWVLVYWDGDDETSIKSAFNSKEKAFARKHKVAEEWVNMYGFSLEEALAEIRVVKKRLL